MEEKETVKFMTREQLKDACIRADSKRLNARLVFKEIPDGSVGYPVDLAIPHDKENMRIRLILDEQGKTGLLDVAYETYEKLPEIILEDGEAVAVKVGKIVKAYEELGEE